MIAFALALALALAWPAAPSPVAEECDGGSSAWPSFRLVVTTAPRVVVGEVVAGLDPDANGRSGRFRLRVDEVLRGEAAGEIELGGSFVQDAAGCPAELRVAAGEVLALALPLADPEGPPRVLALAFVGEDPDRGAVPEGIESYAEAEVRELAATPGLPIPVLIVSAIIVIMAAARRWVAEMAADRAARESGG